MQETLAFPPFHAILSRVEAAFESDHVVIRGLTKRLLKADVAEYSIYMYCETPHLWVTR